MNENSNYIPALRFNWLTPLYDTVVRYTTRETAFKSALVDEIAPRSGDRILDVGCGTGTLSMLMKAREPSALIAGIDADPTVLAMARGKASEEGLEISFEQGMADNLPYPYSAYDCVVSSLFFHHLKPAVKLAVLREIHRVLRPNGRLKIADWGRPSNTLMNLLSKGIVLLDGKETTQDNFDGRMPGYVSECGFQDVRETQAFNTMFGTIRLLTAMKLEEKI